MALFEGQGGRVNDYDHDDDNDDDDDDDDDEKSIKNCQMMAYVDLWCLLYYSCNLFTKINLFCPTDNTQRCQAREHLDNAERSGQIMWLWLRKGAQ